MRTPSESELKPAILGGPARQVKQPTGAKRTDGSPACPPERVRLQRKITCLTLFQIRARFFVARVSGPLAMSGEVMDESHLNTAHIHDRDSEKRAGNRIEF